MGADLVIVCFEKQWERFFNHGAKGAARPRLCARPKNAGAWHGWKSGVKNLFRSRFEFALECTPCRDAGNLAGILRFEPLPETREENGVGGAIETRAS
jgi:hypothetical protein